MRDGLGGRGRDAGGTREGRGRDAGGTQKDAKTKSCHVRVGCVHNNGESYNKTATYINGIGYI